MGLRVAEHAGATLHPAGFRIGRAIHHPLQPRRRDGRRTHGARLQRDGEGAADQPLAAQRRTGGADRQHLGMGGRVVELAGAIAGLRQHLAGCVCHYRAHRHFVARGGGAGFIQRACHRFGGGKGHAQPLAASGAAA